MVTIVLFLFAGAIAYFTCTQVLGVIQTTGRQLSNTLGGVDPDYVAADQFITSLVSGILAVAIFGLAIWVYNYSQAKNLGGS